MSETFNRAERRQIQKVGLDVKYMEQLVAEHAEKLAETKTQFIVDYVSAAVALTLRDKLGFGKERLQRTTGQIIETFNAIQDGYINIDDIKETLKREVGF